jgi:TPR repeat protein
VVSTSGNQELATALGFLNGPQRDSATAAQWLWRAVEKRNTAATVLLAGLYLRGDGVQKNCDQGRVLLDAAADKGSKDAASLLRNLQAFGCQ